MRGSRTVGAAAAVLACLACAAFASARPAIVGGHDAPPGSWPSVVFLYGTFGDQQFGCTGSVVAPQWVVTAAHCAYGAPGRFAETMTAVLATKDYTDPTAPAISVDKLVVHPQYDPVRDLDDIAMFHLVSPAPVPAARLAVKSELSGYVSFDGVPNSAGWGTTDQDNTVLTNVLQEAYLRVRKGDECAAKIPGFDRPTQVCAGTENVAGACHGDSGGPLVAFDAATSEPVLWGLTSYGPQAGQNLPPCSTKLPVVYTWVPAFADFIQATAGTTPAPAPVPMSTPAPVPVPSGLVPPAPVRGPSAACTAARVKLASAKQAEKAALTRLKTLRRRHASRPRVTAAAKRYHALRATRLRRSAAAGRACT